ncbi:EAL domain-containing protein [Spirulina subsalsa FACHB-351]|uniref:EAL domain-containing protein n=1 Tax=Spirulina subsalsa FACHB-351 TaxID=234711 RepID=A0ABT3L3H2_9CYAN|nr:EAL domain-containing protein [Spirulina subsalsa]MCW6036002.1 EAL domain-containing protein [Spirulina subsalsa FACHB-351]
MKARREVQLGMMLWHHPWSRFVGGSLAVVGVWVLQMLGAIAPLEHWVYHRLFELRGERPWDDRVVIVAIDQVSHEGFTQESWSRSPYIKLLQQLAPSQPHAIVFNLLLLQETAEDGELAAAMAESPPVVLGVSWGPNRQLLLPAPRLREQASGMGHLFYPATSGGFVYQITPQMGDIPALSLSLTRIPTLAPLFPPQPSDYPSFWINWQGDIRKIPTYSFAGVLRGEIPPETFRDKIILVGSTATGFDTVMTPFNDENVGNGVHVQAAVISNLLQGNHLKVWGEGAKGLFWGYGLLGMVLGGVLTGQNLRRLLSGMVGISVVWVVLAVGVFYGNGLIPVVSPLLVVGSASAIALLQHYWIKQAQSHYHQQYDSLTGLPQRSVLIEQIQTHLAQIRNSEQGHFALLFFDLNRLGEINAHQGYPVGDRLLQITTQRLKELLSHNGHAPCLLARMGGDEFAILYPQVTAPDAVLHLAQELENVLQQPLSLAGEGVYSNVSIGITFSWDVMTSPPSSPNTDLCQLLLRHAEIAMYQARVQGQSSYAVFNAYLHESAIALWQLETDLRHTLNSLSLNTSLGLNQPSLEREFQLQYQPIVSLKTGKLQGFEALIRWHHPKRGLISPLEFIPMAEETGLIALLGRWVIYKACYQLRTWQYSFPDFKHLVITVNLSPIQLLQPDIVRQVQGILEETGVDSRRLKLEITESSLIANADHAIALLQEFRELGVRLSLDDFGMGYSSLGRLQNLPLHTLKIDKSFVQDMKPSGDSTKIIQMILDLAHSFNMNVVAEGIETPEQLKTLRELNCDYGQGYFFAPPLTVAEVETLLNQPLPKIWV